MPGKPRWRLFFSHCRWVVLLLAATLAFALAQAAQTLVETPAPELASGLTPKALATARKYMVAAAHPLAVDAGLAMLDRGGSAVDAAIATQMVLNLVEPHASGIGGGAFLLHYTAKGDVLTGYDGRETAPMGATPDMFLNADGTPMRFIDAAIGGRSVGVPGLLRMLALAHTRHGRLPWSTLFQPAIALAENGFPLGARLHVHLAADRTLRNDAAARALFYQEDGAPKPRGARLRNPAFAAVLKRIAREGAEAFYRGPLARDIAAAVHAHPTNPGTLTEQDLADYRAEVVKPICAPYRAYRVCGMPPPAGGTTVLQMLESLARFDLSAVRPDSTEAVHLIAEAGRLAYADRDRYAGDPRFTPVPLAGLIDPAYNRERALSIRMQKSMGRAAPGTPAGKSMAVADGDSPEPAGTSHLSIVDGEGNAVSMTTTIESNFGSRLFVHGFFLNNQMTDFSMMPTDHGRAVANAVRAGKRPRSAMSPTMVFDREGRLHMVVGSPGGPPIINYVVKTLVAALDWKMDAQAAVALANFGSRNGPTEIEQGTSYENLAGALMALGHEVRVLELTSGVHALIRTPQGWQGGADPRREGVAKGR